MRPEERAAGIRARRAAAKPALQIILYADLVSPNLLTKSLVKGLLDSTAIALIYGEAGSGKTFFALDLALSIATGLDWFGRQVTKGRVVYVAAEAGPSIRNRVAAWALEKGRGRGDIDFAAVVSPVDLCDLVEGDVERLIAVIGTAALVVIDTVSRALAGGNENAPDDMGAFVMALDRLRDRLKCTVIAVHHVGKDSSKGGRGHSLLHCAVDTEIEVEHRESVFVATLRKQRDGPGGAQLVFALRPVELGRDQDDDPVTSCIVETSGHVPPPKKTRGQAKLALDGLTDAIRAGEGEQRDGAWALKLEVWRTYMARGGLLGEEQSAGFRQAWRRVIGKLGEEGHVRFRDEYVWPTRPVDFEGPW